MLVYFDWIIALISSPFLGEEGAGILSAVISWILGRSAGKSKDPAGEDLFLYCL